MGQEMAVEPSIDLDDRYKLFNLSQLSFLSLQG